MKLYQQVLTNTVEDKSINWTTIIRVASYRSGMKRNYEREEKKCDWVAEEVRE